MKTQVFNSCPQGQFMRPTGAIRFLSTVFAKCGISYPPQNRKGKSRANKNTDIMIKSKKRANKGLKTGRNVKTLKKCVQTLSFFLDLCYTYVVKSRFSLFYKKGIINTFRIKNTERYFLKTGDYNRQKPSHLKSYSYPLPSRSVKAT